MAAVDYFLKIDGVPGESTDDKHKNEIDVESWSWGATQTGTLAFGGGGGAGKVQFQDFHFATALNTSSPTLMLRCATGEHIKSAILTARKAGDGNAEEFLKVTLTDVLVSSYQTGGAATPDTPVLVDRANALADDVGIIGPPDLPRDAVALRYASLQLTQGPQQHIDVAPVAVGTLTYDPKTRTFRTGEAAGGVLTVGTGDGGVTRGVVKFEVADLKGLLGSPAGGRLTLAVSEIRSPRDPGARAKPDPDLHFDVILYAPSDPALTPDDATREGKRIG